jgi:hypothetical protein
LVGHSFNELGLVSFANGQRRVVRTVSEAILHGRKLGETDVMRLQFTVRSLILCSLAALAVGAPAVRAQQKSSNIPPSITTPDKVETRIGTMEFEDGMPSKETVDKVYDNLDFTHAFEAFVNTFQGVNMAAIREGNVTIGIKDNEIIVFSELMDAKSLFLTANADTVYFIGFIDLSKGPMVLETPPRRSARSMISGGAG